MIVLQKTAFHFLCFIFILSCSSLQVSAQFISEYELKQTQKGFSKDKKSLAFYENFCSEIRAAHAENNADSAQSIYLKLIKELKSEQLEKLRQRVAIDYAFNRVRNAGDDVTAIEICDAEKQSINKSGSTFLQFCLQRIYSQSYKLQGKIAKATECALLSKQMIEKSIESESNETQRAFYSLYLVNIQSDIGNLFKESKQFDKSLLIQKDNLTKIMAWDDSFLAKIEKEQKDKELFLANAFNNLGLTKTELMTENSAKDTLVENYLESALQLSKKINNLGFVNNVYYNLSNYYEKIKEFKKQQECLEKALNISIKIDSENGIIICQAELAKNLVRQKKELQRALILTQNSLSRIRQIPNSSAKAQVYQAHTIALAANKYSDSVLIYSDSLYLLNEVDLKERFNEGITEMQTKYETAEKEKEILKQQTELSKNQTQKKLLFGGLAALLLIVGLVYRSLLQKKKASAIIEHQKEIVETKNKEILQSITYSKRLQEAILPPTKLVREKLKNSFVLYKPKDIIAGDFYWLETKKEWTLFAAADCTGHGVPGALVSVVCSNALNRSIKEFNLTDPGKILDKVRELVIETFEKSESEVKDGMDISLCVLDQQTNILKWAGANNPLWIIRDGASTIEEVKPDHQPIGAYSVQKPFTTHEIKLNKGDTLYIFTDGFVDQFGGQQGKKFKSSQLKKLLLSVQNKEMDVQQGIINTAFEKWKSKEEQLDDVCMIGVRI